MKKREVKYTKLILKKDYLVQTNMKIIFFNRIANSIPLFPPHFKNRITLHSIKGNPNDKDFLFSATEHSKVKENF